MDPNTALIVAGIIFGFVSIMHLLRVIYKVEINSYDNKLS